ncbi:MAG: hypothetical protein ABI867_19835 [Kofleriaceae bacterium]
MRWLVIALVACSGRDVERLPPPLLELGILPPPPPAPRPASVTDYEGSEPVTEPRPVRSSRRLDSTYALPRNERGRPIKPGTIVAFVGPDGFYLVEPGASLVLSGNRFAVPPNAAATEETDLARLAGPDGVLLIAEVDTPAGTVERLAAVLRDTCWAFAVTDGVHVTGLWPDPCPAIHAPAGMPELGRNVVAGMTIERDPKRIDLALAAAPEVTVGVLVEAIAAAIAAGFTSPAVVPPVWLPATAK